MSEIRPKYYGEIDLLVLFEILWDEKWKIVATTFVAALIGVVFSFQKPKSVDVSTSIQIAKPSVFLTYAPLNKVLRENNLLYDEELNSSGLKFDNASVFKLFITEFEDYEEMVEVLSESDFVKQSISDLDETGKQTRLHQYAKAFQLIPPSKKGKNWFLKFRWRDEIEGKKLLSDAIQKTLINVQKTSQNNLVELAKVVDAQNAFEIKKLRTELSLIEQTQRDADKKRIQYLVEQSAIAKELGIKNNNVSSGVDAFGSPYFSRGYKAIEKEIELIRVRSKEELLLMAQGYLHMKKKISLLENDLISSQLKASAKLIESDDVGNWVEYNLALADSQSRNKSTLTIAFTIFLGGMIGVLYALISNGIRKRKSDLVKA